MAYPSVDGTYGLVPVKRVDGTPYAGAFRQYNVADGYTTAIYKGDVVDFAGDGTVELEASDAAMNIVGVFVGCSYYDPAIKQTVHSDYFPGGATLTTIKAFVVDDPKVLFKVAVSSAADTVSTGGLATTAIGENGTLVTGTGSADTGVSGDSVDDTSATTNTLPVRIVEGVEGTKLSSGNYTEVLV